MKMLARLVAAWLLIFCRAALAEPIVEQTLLFELGQGGYENYRIPGLVVTAKGTLLATCEARQGNDWGVTDVVLRRGAAGGKQWSAMRKIAHIDGPVKKNPV